MMWIGCLRVVLLKQMVVIAMFGMFIITASHYFSSGFIIQSKPNQLGLKVSDHITFGFSHQTSDISIKRKSIFFLSSSWTKRMFGRGKDSNNEQVTNVSSF